MGSKTKKISYLEERKENESKEIALYMESNHINVSPLKNGMYVIQGTKGKGQIPHNGDSAIVHYTGSLLDGTIFDSSIKRNEPFGFLVGDNKILPAWDDAVKMMRVGSTVTLIIPSSLAYDSVGVINPKTGKYFILPYSPLKFDIQLITLKTK